jgi:hypothetical protein
MIQIAAKPIAIVLLWTALASAECAWVLWMQTKDGDQWPTTAYPTYDECVKERREVYREYKAKKTGVLAECLPDTIDPRTPKAK